MENWKKILLIFILFAIIIGLDLLLYFKTDKLIKDTQAQLGKIEEKIDNNSIGDTKNEVEGLNDKWEKYEKTLSFFIEHDELEKVSAKVAIIKENVKNKEYEIALEDIVETKYLLEHIKDKYNLSLKNIF